MAMEASSVSCSDFRTSFSAFQNKNEKNPHLPSYFRTTELDEWNATRTAKTTFRFSKSVSVLDYNEDESPEKVREDFYLLRGIVRLQALARRKLAKRYFEYYRSAIIRVQSVTRQWLARRAYRKKVDAISRLQSVARRYLVLYEKEDDPHTLKMREMRKQLAEMQKRLNVIEKEREVIRLEKERRKREIRFELEQKIFDESRAQKELIASRKQSITYLRNENASLRTDLKDLRYRTVGLEAANESLNRFNRLTSIYSCELRDHYMKFKGYHGMLKKAASNHRNVYKPKLYNSLSRAKLYGSVEAKQKTLYRHCVTKIMDHVSEQPNSNSKLYEPLSHIIAACESEHEVKIDIETPSDQFPLPPDSDSESLLEYVEEHDDETVSIVLYDEEDLKWIEDITNSVVTDGVLSNTDTRSDDGQGPSAGTASEWSASDSDSSASSSIPSFHNGHSFSSSSSDESSSEYNGIDAHHKEDFPEIVVVSCDDRKVPDGQVDSFTTCSTEMESDCISNASEFVLLQDEIEHTADNHTFEKIFSPIERARKHPGDMTSEYDTISSNGDSSFEVESIPSNEARPTYQVLIPAPFKDRHPALKRIYQKGHQYRSSTRTIPYMPKLPIQLSRTTKTNSFRSYTKSRSLRKSVAQRPKSMPDITRFKARPAPKRRPPKIPVRFRDPSRLRSSSTRYTPRLIN